MTNKAKYVVCWANCRFFPASYYTYRATHSLTKARKIAKAYAKDKIYEEVGIYQLIESENIKGARNGLLDAHIDALELSIRLHNRLKWEGIEYVGQIIQKRKYELLSINGFGKRSLLELQEILDRFNLKLGTVVTNWKPPQRKETP